MRQIWIAFLFLSTILRSQDSLEISATLFLAGDAGEPTIANDPIGKVLRSRILQASGDVKVIFLGDNIYPAGLPDTTNILRDEFEKILQSQVDWVQGSQAEGIFIPGNHDWSHWGASGYDYVRYQQAWIDSLNDEKISMIPQNGCPGPVVLSIDNNTVLLIIDSQWLLHTHDKPGLTSDCSSKTEEALFAQLKQIITENPGKRIVVAAHHPLITYGEHGGYFPFRLHLFPLTELYRYLYIPLPVIGSIYPLYRKWIGHRQDTKGKDYSRMIKKMHALLSSSPGNLHVSGHEHALQHIKKDSVHYIVSGSAAKTENVRKRGYAKFAEDARGFVEIRFFKSGNAILDFIRVDQQKPDGEVIYSFSLPAINRY